MKRVVSGLPSGVYMMNPRLWGDVYGIPWAQFTTLNREMVGDMHIFLFDLAKGRR